MRWVMYPKANAAVNPPATVAMRSKPRSLGCNVRPIGHRRESCRAYTRQRHADAAVCRNPRLHGLSGERSRGRRSARPSPRVVIDTAAGEIEIELDASRAPRTVANFLRYVDEQFFDGTSFYRTVTAGNQPDNLIKIAVIQGGADGARAAQIRSRSNARRSPVSNISTARCRWPGTVPTRLPASSSSASAISQLDLGGRRNAEARALRPLARSSQASKSSSSSMTDQSIGSGWRRRSPSGRCAAWPPLPLNAGARALRLRSQVAHQIRCRAFSICSSICNCNLQSAIDTTSRMSRRSRRSFMQHSVAGLAGAAGVSLPQPGLCAVAVPGPRRQPPRPRRVDRLRRHGHWRPPPVAAPWGASGGAL